MGVCFAGEPLLRGDKGREGEEGSLEGDLNFWLAGEEGLLNTLWAESSAGFLVGVKINYNVILNLLHCTCECLLAFPLVGVSGSSLFFLDGEAEALRRALPLTTNLRLDGVAIGEESGGKGEPLPNRVSGIEKAVDSSAGTSRFLDIGGIENWGRKDLECLLLPPSIPSPSSEVSSSMMDLLNLFSSPVSVFSVSLPTEPAILLSSLSLAAWSFTERSEESRDFSALLTLFCPSFS